MNSPKAPPAPDPKATAAAQTDQNVTSGVLSNMNNMVNQVTPEGNLNYAQTGTQSYTDPSGKTYTIPTMTATQTLSPGQQILYNLNNQTQRNIGQIGVDQSARIGSLLNTPLDLSSTSIDDELYSRYSPRILQQQKSARDALSSHLADQGIAQGSAAYDDAMESMDRSNNDQWNQMFLGGRGQAIQEMTQQRQEPINEITALMSGSQVSNPTYGNTPSANINPANYEGDVWNAYQGQMDQYNQKMASNNAMIGGISGALGALGGGWASGGFKFSDRRLKCDIEQIAVLPNGLPWYSFHYLGEDEDAPLREGVLAQEVLFVRPDAVRMEPNGFMSVDYSRILH